MARNSRLRAVIIAGCALAVVAGVGIGVAFASPSGRPRYVTAAAGTGDVTQTYTTSGTVSRTNTATASFAVDGTVASVSAAVGRSVNAGEVLATLRKGPLQLAVLQAETSVAEAKASLYSAQHPSSSTRSGGAVTGSTAPASSASAAKSSSKASTGVTIDPAALMAVTQRLTAAVAGEAKACEPVFGDVPAPSASPTPSTSATPSATASPSATPSSSAGPSAEPSTPTASPSESASPSPSPSATPTPSPSPTVRDQADVIEGNDPTDAELKACGQARAQVQLATEALQRTVQQLVKPRGGSATGRPSGSSGSGTTGGNSGSNSSTTATVSDAQVASARAKLLQAEQELQAARDDLASAELTAPISGTVGSVELTVGASASSGSITIVGKGNASVTFELPLKTRTLVKGGQQVDVTPAGSSTALSGRLTAVSAVETSGTAGDTPTYATTVTVADPDQRLASGAKASVSIPVNKATTVLRVPTSAVTPTGAGMGTVQVVADARAETAATVNVSTGAVGGGWVEITGGIDAGDLVVLADNTAALPTNSNGRRTTSTTRPSASVSAEPGGEPSTQPGGGEPSGGARPGATPTASR